MIAEAAQCINYVFDMWLNIEPINGITVGTLLGFTLCMGCVLRMITSDGD